MSHAFKQSHVWVILWNLNLFIHWPYIEDRQTDSQTTTNCAVILYMQPNSDGLGQITADRLGLTERRKAQSPGCHHRVRQLSLSLPREFVNICRLLLLSNNLLLDSGCSHIRPADSQEHRRCVILSKKNLLEMRSNCIFEFETALKHLRSI